MAEMDGASKVSAAPRPTITLPPHDSSLQLLLLRLLLPDSDCRSFSQLLTGAMASPPGLSPSGEEEEEEEEERQKCDEVNFNWKDSPKSMLDVYHNLIHSGVRIWVFSGDTNSVIPVTSTRYSIVGQVGGWTQEYKGLTFVTVRGAGHEVPLHKPKQALTLFKSFLSGTSMPAFEQVSDF